ncbi:MAG: hypothetical protein ACOYO1_07365 [Bacteroidales bacterium]
MEKNNLEKDEFISFLLLFTANSDVIINNKEVDFIKNHLVHHSYKKIYDLFENCSDTECIDLISNNIQKYFKTDEEKEVLMTEVIALLKLDDKFSVIEQHFVNALRRIVFEN